MYDKEIGMYYLIARYYNPEHGVCFIGIPDPGDNDDPVTQNGYTYGDNNPVMMGIGHIVLGERHNCGFMIRERLMPMIEQYEPE